MNNSTKTHLVIQCKKCKDIIKSNHRHDYVRCKCGAISIDGGFDYCRLGFQDSSQLKELYYEDEAGNKQYRAKEEVKKDRSPTNESIKEDKIPQKKKRITTASAKAKGRNLQKWTCKKIGELLGMEWGYDDDRDIQPRLMGQSGVDVVLRGEALKQFPFSVECKNQESWSVPAYIKQARKNNIKNTNWLLVLKKKELKNPIVILEADVFFKILEEKKNYGVIERK